MTPQQQPVEAAIAGEDQPAAKAEAAAPPTAAVEAGPSPPDRQPASAPAPAAAMQQDDARRVQRRERHRAEVERKRRWEIRRSLADISADVELLTQEVARSRHACMPAQEAPRDLAPAERAQLAALHTRRLTDVVAKQCGAVLKHVQNHKWSWPFAEPVEFDRYPDYLKAVKQPMDFGTIRRRLEGGVYGAPAEFAADMGLVWANARTYNAPGSDVWHMAGTLQERFEEKWNNTVVPKLAEDEAACRADEANMRRRIAEGVQRAAGEALAAEAARLSGHFEALQARIEEAKSQAAAACQPMPREAKRRLVDDLARLTPEQYEWAIAIILARYPGAAAAAAAAAGAAKTGAAPPSEELSLDLSAADALTLRQLQHFIGACLAAGGAPGDGPSAWPGLLVGSGVQAFKAPGKRPRTARSKVRAAPVQAPAHAQQPPLAPADSLGVGAQKLSTPAQKLPALTLKLPSAGGAEPQPHPQPHLSISVPPASGTPGSSPGPLTAQGSSTVPSLPAGVAAALPQVPSGGVIGSTNSLPPDTVTHDGFKVPPLPKHRTQSLPSTLGVGAPQQQPGGAACSGAAEGVAAAGEPAAAGPAAAQQLPSDAPEAADEGAAGQALSTQQEPTISEAPPACGAASSPAAKPPMMDAKQISEVCAFLHSDVDMTEAGPPS